MRETASSGPTRAATRAQRCLPASSNGPRTRPPTRRSPSSTSASSRRRDCCRPKSSGRSARPKASSWHARHRFCANCGAPSRILAGGWRRGCDVCGAQHFPRTDPVVIMLVVDGDACLFGRGAAFAPKMYSCLAGFMEPGETVEDAVRREVAEEVGVGVGRVDYLASQPWPFPNSLMIGCIAEALTRELSLDDRELEDARWFQPRGGAADAGAAAPGRLYQPIAGRDRQSPHDGLGRRRRRMSAASGAAAAALGRRALTLFSGGQDFDDLPRLCARPLRPCRDHRLRLQSTPPHRTRPARHHPRRLAARFSGLARKARRGSSASASRRWPRSRRRR